MLKKFRLSFQLWSMLVIGLICFTVGLFAENIHSLAVGTVGISPTSGLSKFLEGTLEEGVWFGASLLIGGLLIYFAATGIETFFQTKISPLVEAHVERLSNELDKVGEDTKDLLSAKLLDGVVNASSQSEIRSKLRDFHAKAYGSHCGNDQGLYSAVESKLTKFYEADQPHRSDYNQTVTVVDNGNESIIWHEVCSYKIHAVSFDQQYGPVEKKTISHNVRYSSIVKVAELSFDGEAPKYKLQISVDDREIFNSATDLRLVKGTVQIKEGVEGVVVNQSDSTLEISLDRNIQITRAWTDIQIKETSTIFDDYFISRRNEPTCGAKITMNLPDAWSFELIRFGHPEDWTIHQHPVNTLSAWTKGWVLPGITFFCKWQKPEIQQMDILK